MQKRALSFGISLLILSLLSLMLTACGDNTATSALAAPTVSVTSLTQSSSLLPATTTRASQSGVDVALTIRAATVNSSPGSVKFVKILVSDLQLDWIALDPHNDMYIMASNDDLVVKYDLNGKRLAAFGGKGKGDGEFDCSDATSPSLDGCSLVLDKQANIYVADTLNQRVQKFDKDGKFLLKWGSEGTADGQFRHPLGITVDSAGNVYVTESVGNRVQKFDPTGKFLLKWGQAGQGDGEFNTPTSPVFDRQGNLYIADTFNSRLQKFDATGKFLGKLGSQGGGDGQFQWPWGITFDSQGNFYVCDIRRSDVQKFDASGKFLLKWGDPGKEDGEFQASGGVVLTGQNDVYVADILGGRVEQFKLS